MSYFISHYTVITIHSCCRCDCSQWKNIRLILVAFYIFILIISLASYRGHFTVFLREFYKKKRQKKLNHCCHREKSEKTLLGTCWFLCRISGALKLSMQHVSLWLISRLMNNLVLKYNVIKHLSTLTKNLWTSAVIFCVHFLFYFESVVFPSVTVKLPSLFVDYRCVSPVSCSPVYVSPSSSVLLQVVFTSIVPLLSCILFVWPVCSSSCSLWLVYDQVSVPGFLRSGPCTFAWRSPLLLGPHPPSLYRSCYSQTRLILLFYQGQIRPPSFSHLPGVSSSGQRRLVWESLINVLIDMAACAASLSLYLLNKPSFANILLFLL